MSASLFPIDTSATMIVDGMNSTSSPSLMGCASAIPSLECDSVHRIAVNTSTRSVFIQSWKTAEFNLHLDLWRADKDRDIEALKIVANWQRKYINYQAVYSAYLIGAIDEQQFEAEAEEYVSGAARIEPKLIAPLISRLHRLLDFKLNDNEIAEYLEVDLESVTKALDLLAAEKSNEKIEDALTTTQRIQG